MTKQLDQKLHTHLAKVKSGPISPLSGGACWVVEEGQLVLQAADTEGQVTGRQDEEDDSEVMDNKVYWMYQVCVYTRWRYNWIFCDHIHFRILN